MTRPCLSMARYRHPPKTRTASDNFSEPNSSSGSEGRGASPATRPCPLSFLQEGEVSRHNPGPSSAWTRTAPVYPPGWLRAGPVGSRFRADI